MSRRLLKKVANVYYVDFKPKALAEVVNIKKGKPHPKPLLKESTTKDYINAILDEYFKDN